MSYGRNRIQNSIAEASLTLPLCAIIASVVWFLPSFVRDTKTIIGWALLFITGYIIIETNNINQLIRIRTRMVACMWLIGTSTIGWLHQVDKPLIAAPFLAASYYLLFTTYQEREPVTNVFHTFLMLSLGSVLVPQTLYFAPFFMWYLIGFLRCFSMRCFWAGVVGLLLPFLFWAVACMALRDFASMAVFWHGLTDYQPLMIKANILSLTLQQKAAWGLTSILAFWGGVHYLNNYYNDKIRVRMLLYIYVFQFVVIEVMALLQPHWIGSLQTLLLVTASPLIAHYFALTKTWFCTLLFLVAVLAYAALAELTIYGRVL